MVSFSLYTFAYVACFTVYYAADLVSGYNLLPTHFKQGILNHIEIAVNQCGKQESVFNDATACIEGLDTLPQRVAPSQEALFTGVVEFIDCLDPYKKLLQNCPAATTRDDDLAAMTIVKSLLRDDGALFQELVQKIGGISNVKRPVECPLAKAEDSKTIFQTCMHEFGLTTLMERFNPNDVRVLKNLCNLGSGFRTCLNRVKSANIGTSCESFMVATNDVILDAFKKLEATADDPDAFSRCFAFRTA